jgi:uncharacterized protein YhhL (DUF1145 family)
MSAYIAPDQGRERLAAVEKTWYEVNWTLSVVNFNNLLVHAMQMATVRSSLAAAAEKSFEACWKVRK